MRRVHLDFESRSKADIWTKGAWEYATHPSTEVLCLAYAIDNGPVKIIRYADLASYPMSDPFFELRQLAADKDTLFYAHNAFFEQVIWEHKLMREYSLPGLPIHRWRCTAAKALAVGLPKSLEDAAAALGVKEQKDKLGKALMLKVCKPRPDGTFYQDPEKFTQLELYCRQDVLTERAIDGVLPELTPFEQYVWFEDQLINKRGIYVDVEAVDIALRLIEKETKFLTDEVKRLSDGKLDGVSRRLAVLDYFAKHKVFLPDFQKGTVSKAIAAGQIPEKLLDILRIRQQLGLTSIAKYQALKDAVGTDCRLRDTLMYHSAATGRWGGKLVQLQNLPKGTIDARTGVDMLKGYDYETLKLMYPNVLELLSSCVRGMFIAAPGHDLIVADYAAIEARVLMWFCEETEAVEMFRQGKDIYVDMAKKIGPKASRQLGKQAILGCGYGMGAPKFQATCANYKLDIPLELADAAVKTYRASYPKVRNMWYAQEKGAIQAITRGGKVQVGRVTWEKRGDFLWCKLPSGRELAYHKPEVTKRESDYGERTSVTYMATDSMTKKYSRVETYGGALIENIIQATARDILAGALLNAEKRGYKPVVSIHDEIVTEVPEGWGSVEDFNKLICTLPAWAAGCPISAEGWRGSRYHK